jgi:hypothetical protein
LIVGLVRVPRNTRMKHARSGLCDDQEIQYLLLP